MLASEIDADDLPEFVFRDEFCFEQKLDGHRIILFYDGFTLLACERNGKPSQHNPKFQASSWDSFRHCIKNSLVLDGEFMDGKLYVFDLPYYVGLSGKIDTHSPYGERRAVLHKLFAYEFKHLGSPMDLVPSACSPQDKAALAARCLRNNAEGVMVKRLDGPYEIGRRSKTNCLKAKFVKTADLIIKALGVDSKENAVLEVWKSGKKTEVGHCSMIGKEKVKVGDVVEVKYLYLGANNKLVQPRFLQKRTDKKAKDCFFEQLVPTNKEVLLG